MQIGSKDTFMSDSEGIIMFVDVSSRCIGGIVAEQRLCACHLKFKQSCLIAEGNASQ